MFSILIAGDIILKAIRKKIIIPVHGRTLIIYIFHNTLYAGHREDENGRNGSGHSLSSMSKKQRKARTAFTDHQLQTLEKSFERQKYLSVQDRMELAAKLNLSDTQVKTWYQNRR